MKVGIIGSGGREHAICQSLKISNKFTEIFCFPGNAGTSPLAQNINIDLIHSVPGQTLQLWKKDLKDVIELQPEHISAYGLTVEKGTDLFTMVKKKHLFIKERLNVKHVTV